MTDNKSVQEAWLPVIGNALAFLCLDKYSTRYPDKTNSVLKKVRFLEGLGLPEKDAAGAAGSTPESVRKLKTTEGKRGK
jgi:hypothetical protein